MVNTTVHFWAAAAGTGTLRVTADWMGAGSALEVGCSFAAGDSACQAPLLNATAADGVGLWWPSQMGPQNLYNVTITFTPAGPGALPVATTRRVGFRFAALVTVNDTDPAVVAASANAEGTGNFTMMYVYIVLLLYFLDTPIRFGTRHHSRFWSNFPRPSSSVARAACSAVC